MRVLGGRDAETLADDSKQKLPLSSRTESVMEATPPWVRSPLRCPPSARSRLDEGGSGRRAANESGQMSGEGDYNFRRVAIRRKSNPSYLALGTPRPWSRPSSHLAWAESATSRGQASADAPGKRLGR